MLIFLKSSEEPGSWATKTPRWKAQSFVIVLSSRHVDLKNQPENSIQDSEPKESESSKNAEILTSVDEHVSCRQVY